MLWLNADNFVHSSRPRRQQISTALSKVAAAYVAEPSSEEEVESEEEEEVEEDGIYRKAVDMMLKRIKGQIKPRLFRKLSRYVTVERAMELDTERKTLALLPAELQVQLAEERFSALIEGSCLFESVSGTTLPSVCQCQHFQ